MRLSCLLYLQAEIRFSFSSHTEEPVNAGRSAVCLALAVKPSAEVLAVGLHALLAVRPAKKLPGQNSERGPE